MGKFEERFGRLQQIVSELEKGDASLEDSLKLFEEAAGLSAYCYETLKGAEQKISEISEKYAEGNGENA